MAHETDGHADDHGHGGLGKYLMVGVGLAILTLISFVVGGSEALMQGAPQVGWTVMMAVSCMKAMLVMLFFMHLIWEANWKYVLTIPASIMSLFLMLMLVPDVGLRGRWYSEERLLHAATPQVGPSHSPLEQAHDAQHSDGESGVHEEGDAHGDE
jgi:cytochrome c oxidase subunit 4